MLSAVGHSASFWSQTGKVTVRLEDGSTAYYFIKVSETALGRTMSETEYESMTLVHRAIPDNASEPIGWGIFESDDNVSFVLSKFADMFDERWPLKADFAKCVAQLHLASQDFSPSQFGFHVPKCEGPVVEYVTFSDSWEHFFIEFLTDIFSQERATSGMPAEMEALIPPLLEKVCPRLLRPLETGGRTLRPSLLHGDLWHGNTAQKQSDGKPIVFDGSSIWGHNELELRNWQGGRYVFDHSYIEEYFKYCPPSEPADEWKDRNDLYFLVSGLVTSLCFHKSDTKRIYQKECFEGMKALVARFPDGYTGPHPRKGLEVTEHEPTKVE